MHNMSNTFYNYLSRKIINYFKNDNPNAGDKFYIQFEDDKQVESLYDELKQNTIARLFSYEDNVRNQKYDTYELVFNNVQLIVANAIEGVVHPDFLATLRNLVGVEPGYKNKAILFIHCSTLDSILGGAGSLSKVGMPLNISEIEKDINRRISETSYSNIDKKILELYLENKQKELDGSTASIFEYQDLIESLSNSQITAKEYRKFELFPDDKLSGLSGKELEDRLNQNHQNYIKVSEIHSYGIDESKLEKIYGDDGAKELAKPDWEDIKFEDVRRYIDSKKNGSTIEYNPIINVQGIWDREEGTTKTKSRIRNILVFLPGGEEEYSLSLSFTEHTKKAGISMPKEFQSSLDCDSSGKKITVTLKHIEDKTTFYRFRYEDDAKFDFRIAVLRCNPLILESIKTQYSVEIKKDDSAIRINTDDDEVVINPYAAGSNEVRIVENNQVICVSGSEKTVITISDEYPDFEDTSDIHFSLSTETAVIPMIKAYVSIPPAVIEGLKLWYLKRANKANFEILGDNSLVFGTKKYFTRDEFRKSLELEKRYIAAKTLLAIEEKPGAALKKVDIKVSSSIQDAFDAVIVYFEKNHQLPSLAYLNDELISLYKNYIKVISDEIAAIGENDYLDENRKNLFYLGMVKRTYGEGEILLSPLHPINVAYQLHIAEENIEGLEDDDIELIRRFQQTAFLPYINIDPYTGEKKVFIPVEQMHTPEWKVYVEESLPRYKGSKDFVSKLVAEKIREFVEHFSYLFAEDSFAPIKINLINTGDCREVVQGIVKYYVRELNSTRSKRVIPIHVVMYSDVRMDNAFETMSLIDDADDLFQMLGIDVKVGDMTNEEILDIYRSNVQFYYRNIDDELEYGHITFMEMDDDHQAISTVMDDIPTGIVMDGISVGVPSQRLADTYRTGFGTKYANKSKDVVRIATQYNALNAAINGDAYRSDYCYALRMGVTKQKILERVYDASNWVTFINPKVDLNYFKSDEASKDLMIIHYSDQYNMTSSGYDAITVTKKSKQYQNAISRYLELNGVDDVEQHSKQIINIFNALNGDWLLRMLSYKSHFPIEKLSILSAMKYSVKRYQMDNVVWIPISLEEILRVSGSVGLSKGDSIFSAKNLGFEGLTSDDLLLVGIKNADKVHVTFYPIEVKIGKVKADYLEKGVNQAIKTRSIFDEMLETGDCKDKGIKTRLFRNFFIQQVLVNAGKMQLYEIGDDKLKWSLITDSDLRGKLISEDFEIVDSLIPEMGKAGVIAFREDCANEREFRNHDVLIIEKSKNDGVNILAQNIDDIEEVNWGLIEDKPLDNIESDGNDESNDEEIMPAEVDDISDTDVDGYDEADVIDENSDSARVLIGKDTYMHDVYWEFDNKALANRHLLITGTSGQGKTYSIQTMLYELSKHNVSSVIFDYTEGFMLQQLEEPFKQALNNKINQQVVYSDGVPINPFTRHEVDLAGITIKEKASDVAARLADIFAHVYEFGPQQYSAIFDAALNGMEKYGDRMNMRAFMDELEEVSEDNKAAKSVISKMSPFFHTVEFKNDSNFDWGNILYADEARVNIIQLTLFTREMQVIITEMMLWDAWYYTKKYGSKEKPFVVVLDEAQNLSHTMKSPSAAILTEGRKFGWSAWFATQSLKVLKDDEVVRLLQAAFKLYFKPTDDEMVKIAKQLDATGEKNWLPDIQKLKKGQCIVVGDKMKSNGKVGPSAPVVTNIAPFEERL